MKINKIMYWIPRMISIIFILFLSMFALDILGMELGFLGTIIGLFMHLIPSFILIGLLLIAWKYEKIGGYIFLILAVLFIVFFNLYREIFSFLLVGLPIILIGILFLLSAKYNKNKNIKLNKKRANN